jgi:diguanylate cyclase (GGDEF)-like protein
LNILVVDDNRVIRDIVSAMIKASGHIPIQADGHVAALNHLEKSNIHLILMDIEMPEVDGFELTRKIRLIHPEWIPIIFLSSNDSENYLAKGIDAGGDDYLTKPVKHVILTAKIKAMERIALMKEELDRVNKQLEVLTSIDPLTQVLNRRGFEESLITAWQHNVRQKSELSILMIDIDFFKLYNDNYGHPKGDECLTKVANVFKQSLNRATDSVARYGGEEFVVILPCTPVDGARFKAKDLKLSLLREKIRHEYSTVLPFISISIGVSNTCLGAESPSELIKQADLALYKAKQSGRNGYAMFDETLNK